MLCPQRKKLKKFHSTVEAELKIKKRNTVEAKGESGRVIS